MTPEQLGRKHALEYEARIIETIFGAATLQGGAVGDEKPFTVTTRKINVSHVPEHIMQARRVNITLPPGWKPDYAPTAEKAQQPGGPACPDCKGTGQYVGLIEREDCQNCNGTGRSSAIPHDATVEQIAAAIRSKPPAAQPGPRDLAGATLGIEFTAEHPIAFDAEHPFFGEWPTKPSQASKGKPT